MKTTEEIRLLKLKILSKQCGTIQALADKLDRSHAQVSQWLNSHLNKYGKPRVISNASARYIEQCFNKPVGWMDNLQDEVDRLSFLLQVDLSKLSKEKIELLKSAIMLPEDKIEQVQLIIDSFLPRESKKNESINLLK